MPIAAHRVLVSYGTIWKLPDYLAVNAIDIGYALATILFLRTMDSSVAETCQLFDYSGIGSCLGLFRLHTFLGIRYNSVDMAYTAMTKSP